MSTSATQAARAQMVREQIATRGIRSPRTLRAMETVPRHLFAPAASRAESYADRPLALGPGQTLSQPYIVALMTQLALEGRGAHPRVLEIGSGSGYLAAVLAEAGAEVYGVEIAGALVAGARETLEASGYADRVRLRHGDGREGWPEHAPYDAILVSAAAPELPARLLPQLAEGGRLVAPVGATPEEQRLECLDREESGFVRRTVAAVRFVPLVSAPS